MPELRRSARGPTRAAYPHARRLAVPLTALALLAGGCGNSPSTLRPHSRPAREIADLWWWMLAAAAVVFLGAIVMLALSWWRRGRPGLPVFGDRDDIARRLVVLFGVLVPLVVLIALFVVADALVVKDTGAPARGSTAMTIEVTGRQWFWTVRYPGTRAITANEIHIPANTRINIVARTADVIHSFWVPQLNRKIDMIPGLSNRVLLYANQIGRYRGQCSEFCGLEHANMAFDVDAETPAAFRAWLHREAAPATPPATPAQKAGADVFMNDQCASCHTIRGTSARGLVGPDLTHLGSRRTLAALTIPNRLSELREWIRDPQHVKPGNKMPGLNLAPRDLDAVARYLEGLK